MGLTSFLFWWRGLLNVFASGFLYVVQTRRSGLLVESLVWPLAQKLHVKEQLHVSILHYENRP